ncbi:2-polyprenyl-3-methyl-5-hydroxy-6-metoxy-1,4-benzoquinol methylase [Rhizobium leguminosarum]
MAQNIYDRPEFFAGYSGMRRSVHGLDGASEWPAVRALLPDLAGKRIVDLGCGFGWFSRFAASQGAASVLALDSSEKMIARARADTAEAAITYEIADLEHLTLAQASFDFAYSSLALHYIEDFAGLVATVYHALLPDRISSSPSSIRSSWHRPTRPGRPMPGGGASGRSTAIPSKVHEPPTGSPKVSSSSTASSARRSTR